MKNADETMLVSITPRQIATIRAMFGQLVSLGADADEESERVYVWATNLMPNMGKPVEMEFTKYICNEAPFKQRVSNLLIANGYATPEDAKLKEVI